MKKIDEKGQILIYFTLSFVLFGLFIGLAVDGGRAFLLKAELARKVDPAALAAASRIAAGVPEAQAAACNAIKMNDLSCSNITVTPKTVTDAAGNSVDGVEVAATATMPTTFMRLGTLIGCGAVCQAIQIGAVAVAAPGGSLDLVMDLDDTGSMAGANIRKAKQGAHALVDAMFPGPSSPAKVALVPFRGCYNPPQSDSDCIDGDEYPNSGGDVVSLTNSDTTLDNGIDNLSARGGSGTNVCDGLKRTRLELFEAPGTASRAKAAKFIVLLTDADHNYTHTSGFAECRPSGSPDSTNTQNRFLGVATHNLAKNIKNGVAGDGQVDQKVTIFVILYGPGSASSVTPLSGTCDAALSNNRTNPNGNARYMRTLAGCLASAPGDLFLAPDAQSIEDAFLKIIARLPVRLVI